MSNLITSVLTADPDEDCELPAGEAGIVWDAICFTVLLAQRRVFLSYYFLYVVSDLKSSKILASRSVEQSGSFAEELKHYWKKLKKNVLLGNIVK